MRDPFPRSDGRASLIVIGLGNPFRGDDAAGLVDEHAWVVAERARDREGEPIDLLDRWEDAGEVIVVDAARSGAAPGTVHRLDGLTEPVAAGGSTHAFGLAETLALARALGRAPARVEVIGIEGERFGAGDGLSPAVAAAVERVGRELGARLEAGG